MDDLDLSAMKPSKNELSSESIKAMVNTSINKVMDASSKKRQSRRLRKLSSFRKKDITI